MRRALAAVAALLATQVFSGTAFAPFVTGNAGDPLRFQLRHALEGARVILAEIDPSAIGDQPTAAEVILRDRADEMRSALEHATLEFLSTPGAACAMAYTQPAPRLEFYYDACSPYKNDPISLRLLALHEAVHLIGIGDENTADEVALSAMRLWRAGAHPRGAWRDLAAAAAYRPVGRTGAAIAYMAPLLIVAGGDLGVGNSLYTSQIERLDLATGVWMPSLSAPDLLPRPILHGISDREVIIQTRGHRASPRVMPSRWQMNVRTGILAPLASPASFAAPFAATSINVGNWLVELGNVDSNVLGRGPLLVGARIDVANDLELPITANFEAGLSTKRPLTAVIGSKVFVVAEDASRTQFCALYDPTADEWTAGDSEGLPRFVLPLASQAFASTHIVAVEKQALVVGRVAGINGGIQAALYDEGEDVWVNFSLPESIGRAEQIIGLAAVAPTKVVVAHQARAWTTDIELSILDMATGRVDDLAPLHVDGDAIRDAKLLWTRDGLLLVTSSRGAGSQIQVHALDL